MNIRSMLWASLIAVALIMYLLWDWGTLLWALAFFLDFLWDWIVPLLLILSAFLVYATFIRFPHESILCDDYMRHRRLSRLGSLLADDFVQHVAAFPIAAVLAIASVNLADLMLDSTITRDVSAVGSDIQATFLNRLNSRLSQLQTKLTRCFDIATFNHADQNAPGKAEAGPVSLPPEAPRFMPPGDNQEKLLYRWKQFIKALEISSQDARIVEGLVSHNEKLNSLNGFLKDQSLKTYLAYLFVRLQWVENESEFNSKFLVTNTEGDKPPKENDRELDLKKLNGLDDRAKENYADLLKMLSALFVEVKQPRFAPDELKDIVTFFDIGKMESLASPATRPSNWLKEKYDTESTQILRELLNEDDLSSILYDVYSPYPVTRFVKSNGPFVFAGVRFYWTSAAASQLKLNLSHEGSAIVPLYTLPPVVRDNWLYFVGERNGVVGIYRAIWQQRAREFEKKVIEDRAVEFVVKLPDSVTVRDIVEGENDDLPENHDDECHDLGVRIETSKGWLAVCDSQTDGSIVLEPIEAQSLRQGRAWKGMISRLGSNYDKPTGRQLVSRVIAAYQPRDARPVKYDEGEAYALLIMAFAQPDKNDLIRISTPISPQAREIVDPRVYQVRISDFRKQLGDALLDRIEKGVMDKIEKRTSGTAAFSLGITWTTLRSMIRGAIQLVTFIFFVWGAILLIVRGFISGLLSQGAYFIGVPSGRESDPNDLRWHEVWEGQHFVSAKSSLTRQVIASSRRAGDLLPFVLKRLFISLAGGANSVAAAESIDHSAEEWLTEREREYVFLDFVGWLIPSIGFLGTVIGLGQGLSLANKIVSPDKAVQAQSISDMTSQLGTAFYTTLVALVCVVPFTFFRFLLARLQVAIVRHCRGRVHRLLFSNLVWNDIIASTNPSPNAPAEYPSLDQTVVAKSPSKLDAILLAKTLGWLGEKDLLGDAEDMARLVDNGLLRRSSKMMAEATPSLRFLLENTTMLSRGYWEMATGGLFSYSHLYAWIDQMPPYFQHLAHVLMIKDHRPIRALVHRYHLDPIRCGLLNPQSSRWKVARKLREGELDSARRQAEAYMLIADSGENGISCSEVISERGHSHSTIRHLLRKGLIESFEPNAAFDHAPAVRGILIRFCRCRLRLNDEQQRMLKRLLSQMQQTSCDKISLNLISGFDQFTETQQATVEEWLNAPIAPTERITRFLCLILPDKRERQRRFNLRIRTLVRTGSKVLRNVFKKQTSRHAKDQEKATG